MERPQASQLGHICIRVKDLDATIQFYHGLLGMPIVEHRAMPGSQTSFTEVFPVANLHLYAARLNDQDRTSDGGGPTSSCWRSASARACIA